MLRAVPFTIRTAASKDPAFKSTIFCLATSSACWEVSLPTLVRFGSPDPLAKPAAFFRRADTGGILVIKVKLRSSKTVITAGMTMPGSLVFVRSLNCLQKSMMLTPCWPSAGPTGGAGFAAPAGICSLITVRTFLAMARERSLDLLDLVVAGLDRRLAAEDRGQDLGFGGVLVSCRDFSGQRGQRTG